MTEHKIQPVRGTKDLYGNDILIFNHIIETAKNISKLYGFEELATPIFEFSEIFERNLGEASDIISKEVYKFPDRGDNFLTLRPEFTAGVVRAFISNSMGQNLPQKLFSFGPVFRYDRPQKGRQRQFHQINFELIGSKNLMSDVEMIVLASRILKALGVLDKTILQINSLGCELSRKNYQKALREYFKKFEDNLSENSKIRLIKNPLRILDSKDLNDIEIIKNAPPISDFYEEKAADDFAKILKNLDHLQIKYQHNPMLVRGLDYYNDVVFEFVTSDLGVTQNTVLAGGRYDKLISNMGGSETPAFGFAAGIERLMLMADIAIKNPRPVFVIYVSENELLPAMDLVEDLRKFGIYAEIYFDNMKKQIKKATQINAKYVIFLGESEVKNGILKVKDFDSGQENQVRVNDLMKFVKTN